MVRDHQDIHVVVLGRDTLALTEPPSTLHDHRVSLSVHDDVLGALLAFPEGRVTGRRARAVVIAAYVVALVLQAPLYLFASDEPPIGY